MTITDVTRSLPQNLTHAAFTGLTPDSFRASPVRKLKNTQLLAKDALTAGNDFHHLLRRMGDNLPLSPKESAYFPWVSALRRTVWALGASEMEIDADLIARGSIPHGTCDLLVHGGPATLGVIEAKVIVSGTQETLRGRDLAQLAAYARLIAGRGSFDEVWAGLAYIELETRLVRLAVFNSSRPLVLRTLDLLRAA